MKRPLFFVLVASAALLIVMVGYFSLGSLPTQAAVDEIVKQADDPIKVQYREFLAMKARWQAKPVDHYRLRVRLGDSYVGNTCERDVEVKSEQVLNVFADTCTSQGMTTVTELFTELEQQIPQDIQWLNGCGCYLWVSHSEYDPTWNYPRKINVTMDSMTSGNVGAYKYRLVRSTNGEGRCRLLGMVKTPVEVLSFTVLA